MIPVYGDNSEEAKATRMAAIKANPCPACGAGKGFDCRTARGGTFAAAYFVHLARLKLSSSTEDQ
jgi:hypothetical protein